MNGHKRVHREIIAMADLNKVVLCLEKIKSKNMKDFNCDCEDAIKLIDKALAANIIKSVIFNGKVAYRIVRADSVGDDTVLVPETQEIDGSNEHVSTVFLEKSLISQLESSTLPEHQKRDDANISTIIENKLCLYFESIEKRFIKIENHLTGISSSKSTTEPANVNDNFDTIITIIKSLMATTNIIIMTRQWKNQSMIKQEKN